MKLGHPMKKVCRSVVPIIYYNRTKTEVTSVCIIIVPYILSYGQQLNACGIHPPWLHPS